MPVQSQESERLCYEKNLSHDDNKFHQYQQNEQSCTRVLWVLRGYHTQQGDDSLKSVERFDYMMFVCRFQASL